MQVMPMQPLLLHSHPLQLCRLSMHGLQLVSSRHLGNGALKLSWICSSYGKDKHYIKKTKLEELDSEKTQDVGCMLRVKKNKIMNQTAGGAASHGHEEDR